ncbi:MAG: nitrate ABC transporter permease [Gemmatimonadaceae bacterium]
MEDVSLAIPSMEARGDWRRRARELAERALPTAAGAARSAGWSLGSVAIALGVWQLVCLTISKDFPTPLASFRVTLELLRNAFAKVDGMPGIGFQVLASMRRIAIGFSLSAAVAIPAGILIGVSPTIRKLFDPIVQVLRPVSPLVWFPLALVAFKNLGGVSSSTLFTIFVTSLWPTLINTAVGVSSLPADYRIVAKVFRFSRARYLRKILLPHTLPYVLTGLRLSMGTAWLVIVAAEMLSGDMGIGFFAWDAYNAGSYEKMIAAVAAIGGVGLALDRGFSALSRRFDYRESSR